MICFEREELSLHIETVRRMAVEHAVRWMIVHTHGAAEPSKFALDLMLGRIEKSWKEGEMPGLF